MGKPIIYENGDWHDYGGSGGGGSTNYNDLSNKPQINGITLQGNRSLAALGAEAVANKVTALSAAATDAQYASAKAIYDALQGKAELPAYPAFAANRAYQLQLVPVGGVWALQWIETAAPPEDLIIIEGGTNHSSTLGIEWTASSVKTSSAGTGTAPTLVNTASALEYTLESDTQNPSEVARNGSVKMSGIDLSQYATAEITWKASVQLTNANARRTRAALAPSLAAEWYTNASTKREINMGDHPALNTYTENFALSLAGLSSTDLLLFGVYVAARQGYIKTEITRLVLYK